MFSLTRSVLAWVPLGLLLSGAATNAELVARYDFSAATGGIVHDVSGHGQPLNLRVDHGQNVEQANGALEIRKAATIRSQGPAKKIVAAVRRSGELTVEAWIRSAELAQQGPARIIAISKDPGARNFTLGQDGNRYDVRLRSTRTSANGTPSVMTRAGAVAKRLTHVVYVRERSGRAMIYVDGRPAGSGNVAGDLRNWDESWHLALGNEQTHDRPWLGTFHRVCFFDHAVPAAAVKRLFEAGSEGEIEAGLAEAGHHPGEELFETRIAPLIAEHCLECHDTATREGGLDLSRKRTAFLDESIVPGRAAESAVWEAVLADDMPKKRPPLSSEEKALLRKWIDGGAQWSLEVIDPVVHRHQAAEGHRFVQRLTVPEYVATVRAATGVEIDREARELLPPDLRADGFSNTAYNLNVDLKHVAAYASLAATIAGRMDVAKFCRRFHASRKLVDKDNRALIAAMGKWLLRGPLDEPELAAYRGIATTVASTSGGFDDAMRLVIEAMLQSPRFLYRIERRANGGGLGPYELASRLSYIIWGAAPDEDLFRAAEQGGLFADEELTRQVDRMLRDPRAVQRSRQFAGEWLNLARLQNLRPEPRRFPTWDAALASDMRNETLKFFEEVAWRRPLAELLNARISYVTPRLARHYGLAFSGDGMTRMELPTGSHRGGLLTQGSVLTIGGDEASMVARGLFVLKDLLRGAVKDPPPCVNVTPVPTRSGLTQRGIAEERIANANCGGCHARFEPLAFGLEKFDGVGRWLAQDTHGNPLRDDGAILFPGTATPVEYRNARELFDLLAASDRVAECLTWKVAQFALGRPLTARDVTELNRIHRQARIAGGRYGDVIRAIVMSDLVRTQTGT